VRRDVQEAVRLISLDAQWDQEVRLEVMGILAKNPEIRLSYPNGFLYDATEAAELGEPGAMTALIELKLSGHSQFGDKAGGCALAEHAAKGGCADAAKYLRECDTK